MVDIRPDPRLQRGQAIVLIAIMLAVVVGMAALAIDGARAYTLRRDLQAAVDAAALAAGDTLQQGGTYISAERAASTIFGTNLRLYNLPTCSPGYGTPGAAGPVAPACTFSDGTLLTQIVSALGPQGSQFTMFARRSLVLQFARILTSGVTPRLAASASGSVNNLLYAPTVAALSPQGCGGVPGVAISTTTGGNLGVVGDMVSNGAIVIDGSAQVTGDVYSRCQSSVPNLVTLCYPSGNPTPCTYPDVAGMTRSGYNFVDPNYPPPAVIGSSWPRPTNFVVLSPGTYSLDPAFGAGLCYFLAPGAYKWQGGYTNNGSFVSNELKPPDEPKYDDNTQLASHQMWNTDGVKCFGAVGLSAVTVFSNPIPHGGTWAFVVTSVRTDTYNGLSYTRESAPSYCHTVAIGGSNAIQIQISNVPGATSYNVYAAPPNNGCSGPFGLAGNIPFLGPAQENDGLAGCPALSGSGCSLGNETAIFDSTELGSSFAPSPNPPTPPGVIGSYPPSGETAPLRSNLPNENPSRAAPPAGDRANENQCDALSGALTTCPGPITPGGVVFYIPSTGCLNDTSNGDNVVFSGYQYDWIVVYEPGNNFPPANICSNTMGAAADSAFIGLAYMPAAGLTVNKASAFRTDESGGLIANTITFSGQLPTVIGDPADYGPVPPASKLVG
jgi:Putative Flp pilus-assembly TadE/G-like